MTECGDERRSIPSAGAAPCGAAARFVGWVGAAVVARPAAQIERAALDQPKPENSWHDALYSLLRRHNVTPFDYVPRRRHPVLWFPPTTELVKKSRSGPSGRGHRPANPIRPLSSQRGDLDRPPQRRRQQIEPQGQHDSDGGE